MATLWIIEPDEELQPSDIPVADVPPSSRCAGCGQCCKNLPGAFLPADLGADASARYVRARELLRSGCYSIDWLERPEGQFVFFLRPSTVHQPPDGIFDPSHYGGQCVFLGSAGCTLPRTQRPAQCKALVPGIPGDCLGLTKHDVTEAWRADSGWLHTLGMRLQSERAGRG